MTSVTNNVLQSTATIIAASIKNEFWLAIGYGKRPKRGAWFQRFRKKWRVSVGPQLSVRTCR